MIVVKVMIIVHIYRSLYKYIYFLYEQYFCMYYLYKNPTNVYLYILDLIELNML